MCLRNVTFTVEPGKDYCVGYRVYGVHKKNSVMGSIKNWSENKTIRFKRWHHADKIKSLIECSNTTDLYQAGFHIFLRPEHAQEYSRSGKVVKVRFKNIIGFGKQGANGKPYDCVIAQSMYIEGFVNE